MRVFWSWQSDRDPKLHHYFVRDSLKEACKLIAKDPEYTEANRPEVDHDTKDISGTPDIAATILTKISGANVFVADVTPVGKTEPRLLQPNALDEKLPSPKYLQNPNVMSELGYAERAIGQDKIILVANKAHYHGPEALPFDWRHRSGPSTYNLQDDSTKTEINAERKRFAAVLKNLIQSILANQVSTLTSEPMNWQPSAVGDPCIWAGAEKSLEFRNTSLSMPTQTYSLSVGPRLYARIIPSKWPVPTRSEMNHWGSKFGLFMRGSTGDWGVNRDGVLSVWSNSTDRLTAVSATQWFQQTGEIWSVSSSPFGEYKGRMTFACQMPFRPLETFLNKSANILVSMGGEGPFDFEFGAGDLSEVFWPGRNSFEICESVESFVECFHKSKAATDEEIREALFRFWNRLSDAFGIPAADNHRAFELAADLLPLPKQLP